MNKKEIFKSTQCTGCRACELACSFHYIKIFNPNIASIEINKTMEGFEVGIYNAAKDFHLACDLCTGEDNGRQCVEVCSTLFKKELAAFIQEISKSFPNENKQMGGNRGEKKLWLCGINIENRS